MNQNQNIKLIKKIIDEKYKDVRYIKIHGGKYQEAGLPDLMILIPGHKHIWIEIKRDWNDTPTKLQMWNVADLQRRGYMAGFVAGDEFKLAWNDPPQKLLHALSSIQKTK